LLEKELYSKIRDFVISASKILSTYVEGGERIPYTIVEKYKVKGPGSYSMTHEPQPLVESLILNHEEELSNMSEFKICAKLMRLNGQVSIHLDKLVGFEGGSKFRNTLWGYLRYFLSPIFENYLKNRKLDEELLKKLYSAFEDFIIGNRILIHDYAYLMNFDSDVDSIDIEKDLAIRKVANEELQSLLQSSGRFPSMYSFTTLPIYAMDVTYSRRKVIGSERKRQFPDSAEKLHILIIALRLFKPGIVGFNEISTAPETPFLWGSIRSGMAKKTFVGQKYHLKQEEIKQFKDFWKKFSSFYASKPQHFAIALRRFGSAYERTNPQDKLIDYMIAYEALFFKQGESGEFRHKLSTRVSRLLGKTYGERKAIAEEIRDFYDKRSKVVHGEKVELPREFVGRVERHLRDSMNALMKLLTKQDHSRIIMNLDLS